MLVPSLAQNRVKTVYTWQEKLNTSLLADQTQQTQLCRTLYAGYNSICLPMSLSAEELQAAAKDVQIERLAQIRQEGDVLGLYFLDCTAEGLQAGVPYLIFSPTQQTLRAKSNNTYNDQLQSVTLSDNSGENQVTFGSSWEAVRVAGRYGIPAQQDTYMLESVLICTDSEKAFLPTRCGFTWDKQAMSATRMEIKHVTSLGEGTTAIETLRQNNAIVDIYDLQGKLLKAQCPINDGLEAMPQGIYVVNGQKVAVK